MDNIDHLQGTLDELPLSAIARITVENPTAEAIRIIEVTPNSEFSDSIPMVEGFNTIDVSADCGLGSQAIDTSVDIEVLPTGSSVSFGEPAVKQTVRVVL